MERNEAPAGSESREAAATPSLAGLQESFVLHWGEMANAWGINRTMGQIHALLYVSPDPLPVDEIMARLKISRGNASMNLRGLEDWGIVQRVHYTGDRREYFRSITDVWELCRTLLQERKRREFDPTMRSLRQFLSEAGAAKETEPGIQVYRERVGNLLQLLDLIQLAWDQLLPLEPQEVSRLVESGARAQENP